VERLTTKMLANPKLTRVGKGGPGGRSPHGGGRGGCPPTKSKEGGELPTLSTCPRVGPNTLANPQPTRVGNRWWRGRSPLPGGLGDVPPRTLRRGESSPPYQPAHEWDPKLWRTLSPRGWENRWWRGRSPLPGGLGDVPPRTLRRGASSPP